MSVLKPMLACSEPVEPASLIIPPEGVWVSPKLDGFRCLIVDAAAKSRKLLDLPNRYVQQVLGHPLLHGLDGEITVGPATAADCINQTTSGINSIGGEPDFMYHVFDCWHTPKVGYRQRYGFIRRRVLQLRREGFPVSIVPQVLCHTPGQVESVVGEYYMSGYEGGIVRSFNDLYKYGRSTRREGYLLKVKESIDFEFQVIGFVEQMRNENALEQDEMGYAKRSSKLEGMVPAGTLGKLLGIHCESGQRITVGRGKMKAEEAQHVWDNKELYIGAIGKARSAKHGVKELPRFPRFITWRPEFDIGSPA